MAAGTSSTRRGVAWAFFGSAMAATFMVPWKVAAEHGEPRMAVLVLLSVAATLNTLAALLMARRNAEPNRETSWRTTLGVAGVFAVLTLTGNHCSAEAIARISGALLAVMQRSEVILVGLMGAVFLRERAGGPFWLGTLVAAGGLWVLQRPDAAEGSFDPIGALWGLGSAVSFGTMVVITRRYIARVRVLPLNAIRLWLSVALWFAVERELPTAADFSPGLLWGAGLAAFFGPFLSRLGALQSARDVPANVTALASLATPVMTLVLALVVLGNVPTGSELLGGGIMLAGIAIPMLAMARSRAAPPPHG